MKACDLCLENLHSDGGLVEATSYCSGCERDICDYCTRYVDGEHYCKECAKKFEGEKE